MAQSGATPTDTSKFERLSLPERVLSAFLALSRQMLGSPEVAGDPALLVCWPWSSGNKFQNLLYANAKASGFAVLPIQDLKELEAISWPGPIVLHAHWFSQIYAAAKDDDEAEEAGTDALRRMLSFRTRSSARLLWTAHNVFPHRMPYRKAALRLRHDILATFDGIHLMADEHKVILETAYAMPLPRRFVVPHPLYTGAYPDEVSRTEARAHFGISQDATVILNFGALHAYKGLDLLLRAFAALPRDDNPDTRLLLAGRPADPAVAEALRSAADKDSRIILCSEFIADEDVQNYFRAADIVVLPYAESLNSGVVWLSFTFGLPIILPNAEAFQHVRNLGGICSFSANSAEDLAEALTHSIAAVRAGATQQLPNLSAHTPEKVSSDFFRSARALTDTKARVIGGEVLSRIKS